VYVQLLSMMQLDIGGQARAYHRGDWVDLGQQTALKLIANRQAQVAIPSQIPMPPGCAVVVRGDLQAADHYLTQAGITLPLLSPLDETVSTYQRVLYWQPEYKLRTELLAVGFGFLDRWEIAAPLWSYRELAARLGSETERAETKAIVRDLRVPCYDPRLLFVRRCEATDRLLAEWRLDRGDERLSLLRAIYRVKPLMLALPVNWERGKEGAM